MLRQAREGFPFIDRIIGDGGYQGPKMTSLVVHTDAWRLEIVKRSDLHRFAVLPNPCSRTLGQPASGRHPPAIHQQVVPVHIAGLAARQEERRAGHVHGHS